jgi:hypothetical protein
MIARFDFEMGKDREYFEKGRGYMTVGVITVAIAVQLEVLSMASEIRHRLHQCVPKDCICNEPTRLSIQASLQVTICENSLQVRRVRRQRVFWPEERWAASLWLEVEDIVDVEIIDAPEGKLVSNPAKRPAGGANTMEGRVGYLGWMIAIETTPVGLKIGRADRKNNERENVGEELNREAEDRWQGLSLVLRGHGSVGGD